jgi:glucose uptake protein
VYQPEAYVVALLFMLVSMLCWGSWANTMKLAPGWRFQLYYWDFVLGVLLTSLLWGLTLGSVGGGPSSLLPSLAAAGFANIVYALTAGAIFNVANLLLVAAIELAGLAVAFPIGIGLALVVGVLLNYALSPRGNPVLLFGGVGLILLAVVLDAMAYRRKETVHSAVSARAIGLSVGCGVLMGLFYPFVTRASSGEGALGPYAVSVVFAFGVLLCAIPVNYAMMRRPLTADVPLTMRDYLAGRTRWHVIGMIGGLIWCTGTVLNFVAANAHIVGPAISYAIGQGATLVSAIWGVFVWHEFHGASAAARRLLRWMFVCFVAGLGLVAVAPIVGQSATP